MFTYISIVSSEKEIVLCFLTRTIEFSVFTGPIIQELQIPTTLHFMSKTKKSLIRQKIFDSEYFWVPSIEKQYLLEVKVLSIFSWVTLNSTSEFMLLWKRCFWSPQMQLSCFQQALCGWILNNIISRCIPACCRVLYLQLKFFIGKW